jgi:hypothetical protein
MALLDQIEEFNAAMDKILEIVDECKSTICVLMARVL